MSKEEIKEGLESIAGGSDKEPKKYPEIVVRSVKYGGPHIKPPKMPIKPLNPFKKPELPVKPFTPAEEENK